MRKRISHLKDIARWGWFVVYEVAWIAIFTNIDLIVGKYGSDRTRGMWEQLTHPHWGWHVWLIGALVIAIVFLFEGSYRTRREENEKFDEETKRLQGEITKGNEQISELLAPKPTITETFAYEGRQAVIAVTNNGAIAYVWASLSVEGLTRSGIGPFARWSHSGAYKVQIGKGETHHLLLASLRIEGVTSQWVIHHATESGVGITDALYSSLVGSGDDGQAPDVDMYIKVFSDPDCAELPKEWHIVLHSHRAELGN